MYVTRDVSEVLRNPAADAVTVTVKVPLGVIVGHWSKSTGTPMLKVFPPYALTVWPDTVAVMVAGPLNPLIAASR